MPGRMSVLRRVRHEGRSHFSRPNEFIADNFILDEDGNVKGAKRRSEPLILSDSSGTLGGAMNLRGLKSSRLNRF